jgi:hypothetical protein
MYTPILLHVPFPTRHYSYRVPARSIVLMFASPSIDTRYSAACAYAERSLCNPYRRRRRHHLKKLSHVFDQMRRCVTHFVSPCPSLSEPFECDGNVQKYSTTALAAVHLMSQIVCASANASSAFEGWGGAAKVLELEVSEVISARRTTEHFGCCEWFGGLAGGPSTCGMLHLHLGTV